MIQVKALICIMCLDCLKNHLDRLLQNIIIMNPVIFWKLTHIYLFFHFCFTNYLLPIRFMFKDCLKYNNLFDKIMLSNMMYY